MKEILKDYSIAKLQSAIAVDVNLLRSVGIDVRGLVDTGTIFMMIRPGDTHAGYGLKHQINAIWSEKSLIHCLTTIHTQHGFPRSDPQETEPRNDQSRFHYLCSKVL